MIAYHAGNGLFFFGKKHVKPIALQAVQTFPRLTCPYCSCVPHGFEWKNGDTVEVGRPGEPYAAHLMWGTCPQCGKELYSLELSVVSEGQGGFYLLNDHSFEAEGRRFYTATRGRKSWGLEHYWNVDNLSFYRHFGTGGTVHHSRSWLDIHCFDFLEAPDRPGAFATAAKITRAMAPDLARIDWG